MMTNRNDLMAIFFRSIENVKKDLFKIIEAEDTDHDYRASSAMELRALNRVIAKLSAEEEKLTKEPEIIMQYDRWIATQGNMYACTNEGDVHLFLDHGRAAFAGTPVHVTVTITRKGDE